MKFFTNKTFLFKLIACLCLCFALLGFGFSTVSQAEVNSDRSEVIIGGKLIEPVVDLLLGIGDAIINIVQQAIMGTEAAITIDTAGKIFSAIAGAILAIIIVGLACTLIGSVLAIPLLGTLVAGAVGVLAFGGFSVAYNVISGALLPDITLIPKYTISPEEIFRGEILLFDVNIFNPRDVYVQPCKTTKTTGSASSSSSGTTGSTSGTGSTNNISSQAAPIEFLSLEQDGTIDPNEHRILKVNLDSEEVQKASTNELEKITGILCGIKTNSNGKNKFYFLDKDGKQTNLKEVIESGRVGIVYLKNETSSITFNGVTYKYNADQTTTIGNTSQGTTQSIDPVVTEISTERSEPVLVSDWNATNDNGEYTCAVRQNGYQAEYYFYYKDRNPGNTAEDNIILTSANNSALELKNTIAKWYYALRNLSIVVLMVILVYIGIRMLTSSLAADKAKYKQMMLDWLVAMCLVFIMQYIMVFLTNFTESLVDLLSNVADSNLHVIEVRDANSKLVEKMKEAGMEEYITNGNDIRLPTNLMGKARMLAQEHDGTSTYIGYAICFLVLVIYTVIFMLTYAKRLLYTMFLTIISPLIAISYPIDKIGDNKSQAFDMWLKEYVFNLIIQPFHLLLYVVFISTAFNLAGNNIIYSLVAIGFMMPAEKFLRTMFGFDKAKTPGFLGGAAGAAVTMSAISKLAGFAGKGTAKAGAGKNNIKMAEGGAEKNKKLAGKSARELEEDFLSAGDEPEKTDKKEAILDTVKEGAQMTFRGGAKATEGLAEATAAVADVAADAADAERREEAERAVGAARAVNSKRITPETMDSADTKTEGRLVPPKSYGQAMLDRIKKNAKTNALQGAQMAFKGGTKLAMGLTGAAAGVAAGVASGELGSVSKYGVTGAYAGSSIGKGMSGIITNGIPEAKDKILEEYEEIRKEQYGSDYSKYLLEKEIEKTRKDKETRALLAKELNLDSARDIEVALDDLEKYQRAGIHDHKVSIKAMKQASNPNDRANKDLLYAAKLSTFIKDPKALDEKMEKLRSKVGDSQAAQARVDRLRDNIEKINKDNLY